jgi:hypothetical protein
MRKYDLKGLHQLAGNVSDELQTIRAVRMAMQAELKSLDSEDARKKFTPGHLIEQKAAIRSRSLERVRSRNNEIAELSKTAAAERHEWSRENLLASSDHAIDATDKSARLMARMENSIRRLELSTRLSRMNDAALVDYSEHQAELGDTLAVSMSAEEGRVRGGLSGMKTQQMLANVPCEEADESAAIYDQLERNLKEAAAIEEHVERPDAILPYAELRSAEISRTAASEPSGDDKKDPEGDPPQTPQDAPDLDFTDIISPQVITVE